MNIIILIMEIIDKMEFCLNNIVYFIIWKYLLIYNKYCYISLIEIPHLLLIL